MKARIFHLGDVLSITTGRLMSPRHMSGVHDILSFMTGDEIFTHQAPRVMTECAPFLLQQHPSLVDVQIPEINGNFDQVLEDLCAEYGEEFAVTPLPPHAHEFIDPHSELAEKVPPHRIVIFGDPGK